MGTDTANAFRGTFDHKLDAKGRVAVPADWRPNGSMDLLLRMTDRSGFQILRAYTIAQMDRIIRDIENSEEPGLNAAKKRMIIGHLNETSVASSINSQGKLQLPKKLIESAQLPADVKLVGRGNEFEIHNPDTYEAITEKEAQDLNQFNELFGI